MAIPHATVLQVSHEGIDTVSDLAEFDKSPLKQIADNLRRPGGRIADPSPGAGAGATIPTPPFVFGAKSQMRMEVACNLIRFYDTIGRPLTAANLKWDVMYKFGLIYKPLVARQLKAQPETPRITQELPIMKWVEAFEDHLHRCVGVRMIPLSYVIRANEGVDPLCPPPKLRMSRSLGSGDQYRWISLSVRRTRMYCTLSAIMLCTLNLRRPVVALNTPTVLTAIKS